MESRAKYWGHAKKYFSWYPNHPATLNTNDLEDDADSSARHVPLHLYADDTRFSTNEKLGVIMLGCVLDTRRSSMQTHWPLFVVRLESCTI